MTTSSRRGSCSSSASSSASPKGPSRRSSILEQAVEAAERVGDDELTCTRAAATPSFTSTAAGDGPRGERSRACARGGAGRQPVDAGHARSLPISSSGPARPSVPARRWPAWAPGAPGRSQCRRGAAWYLALLEWRAGNWDAAAAAATRRCDSRSSSAASRRRSRRGPLPWSPRTSARSIEPASWRGQGSARPAGREWRGGLRVGARVRRALRWRMPRGARASVRADHVLARAGHPRARAAWHLPDLLDALLAAATWIAWSEILAPWEERARALDRAWALAIAARTRALLAATRGDLDGGLRRLRAGVRRARAGGRSVPACQDAARARRDPAAGEAAPRRAGDARAGDGALRRTAARRCGPTRRGPSWRGSAAARLA